MKTGVIVLSVVVASCGVGSALLGFIAEGTKLAPRDIEISRNQCVYPANPAFALGIVAALLLLVAQITTSAAGGCCGCCKPGGAGTPRGTGLSREQRVVASSLSVFSWIAALIAERPFLQGVAGNARMTHETRQDGGCYYVKDGVFSMAAILSIVATLLGIISYIRFCTSTGAGASTTTGGLEGQSPEDQTKHDGIAIGQPAPAQQHAQAV